MSFPIFLLNLVFLCALSLFSYSEPAQAMEEMEEEEREADSFNFRSASCNGLDLLNYSAKPIQKPTKPKYQHKFRFKVDPKERKQNIPNQEVIKQENKPTPSPQLVETADSSEDRMLPPDPLFEEDEPGVVAFSLNRYNFGGNTMLGSQGGFTTHEPQNETRHNVLFPSRYQVRQFQNVQGLQVDFDDYECEQPQSPSSPGYRSPQNSWSD